MSKSPNSPMNQSTHKLKHHSLQVILRFRQQLSSSSETEGYHITVVKAPGRSWGGPFLPEGLDDDQMKAVRQLYNASIQRRLMDPDALIDENFIHALRIAGEQLFRVFPETVQEILFRAQATAQEQNQPLEIILDFDLSARQLLSLPWELLHHPEGRFFFALRGCGITRQLRFPAAPKIAPGFRPESLLGVWAEPEGISALGSRARYQPSPNLKSDLIWITGPDTLGQLERKLKEERFDGLHIVAHGRAGKQWSDLTLAFAGEDGLLHWVSPDQLAVLITQFPQIRFVYLDVCASTLSKAEQGPGEFLPGGLASSLVRGGVPVVIAMQDTISQSAAGLFAQTFYQELASGRSLPDAITQARRAIRIQMNDPIQWSIPAFYCQQHSEEKQAGAAEIADRFLENIHWVFDPFKILILAAVFLAGWLSRALAGIDLMHLGDWRALGIPVLGSLFLPVAGGLAMRAGHARLAQSYKLDARGWLGISLAKYFAASVWGMMGWLPIWLGWLFLAYAGWLDRIGFSGRQALWFLGLLELVGCGYLGARQSIRQSQLFLQVGMGTSWLQAWLLFLVIPLIPLGFSWLMTRIWGFLVSPLGFTLVLLSLIGLAILVGRIGQED